MVGDSPTTHLNPISSGSPITKANTFLKQLAKNNLIFSLFL